MRVRAAKTLVFSRDGADLVGFNYLAQSAFGCSPDLLEFIGGLDDWATLSDVAERASAESEQEAAEHVDALVAVGALIEEGSDLARKEDDYDSNWRWGVPAGMLHFSVQDRDYISLEDSEQIQMERVTSDSPPPLYFRPHGQSDRTVELPQGLPDSDLLQLMAKRRTVRAAKPRSIDLETLSDCLFAGMGIIGETKNCVGSLPLSMTPSGGARNPYEAYVVATNVDGLEPGVYHYSAMDHVLVRVGNEAPPSGAELLGGQDWVDEMPCVILLVAHLDRSMWKYADANAYRVVLIEAGHIGQNIMLAATDHGLTACPSAALNHATANRCVGTTDEVTQTPVYALALGHPDRARAAI